MKAVCPNNMRDIGTSIQYHNIISSSYNVLSSLVFTCLQGFLLLIGALAEVCGFWHGCVHDSWTTSQFWACFAVPDGIAITCYTSIQCMQSSSPLVKGSGLCNAVHASYQDAPLDVAPLLECSHIPVLPHCSGYCYTFLEEITKKG